MSKTTTGWVLFVAAFSMMFGLMAVDVSNLTTWHEAFSPAFVGSAMAHFSVVGMAFVGGKLIPEERNGDERTRAIDTQPPQPPVTVNVVNAEKKEE